MAFHHQYICGKNLIISVVSGLDSARVISAIEGAFADLPEGTSPTPSSLAAPWSGIKTDSVRVGNRQSYLYFGYSFKAQPQDRPALYLLNSILQDRLTFDLRETKGWAYRMGSQVGQSAGLDYFYVYMGTGKENIQPAIAAIKKHLEDFAKMTVSREELTKARNSIIAAITRRRASRENQAYFLGLNAFNGKTPAEYREILKNFESVTVTDLERVKKQYFSAENYLVIYTIPLSDADAGPKMPGMPPGMGKMRH